MEEIWKDLIGYEGKYQISSLGKIKSTIFDKHRIILGSRDRAGYLRVKLWEDGSVSKTLSVHRLVAKHFVLNIDNKPEVNHINGIKSDNRSENLEWCTRGENQLHAYRTGLKKPAKSTRGGKWNSRSKPVLQIFPDGSVKKWDGVNEAAKSLGLGAGNISSTCLGRYKQCYGYKWEFIPKTVTAN